MLGAWRRRTIDNAGELEVLEVAAERVDSVVAEDVLLLKLDVEGHEPPAFLSAAGVFEAHRCAHAGRPDKSYQPHMLCAPPLSCVEGGAPAGCA